MIKYILFFFLLFSNILNAKNFNQKATIDNPFLINSKWCDFSGELLINSYKTNYIVKLTDGTNKQYASIRFLANDYDSIKSRLKQILVIDSVTQKFIDVSNAFFVVNSKAKTKFTQYSKIAFSDKKDALKFIEKYQGDIRKFEFVLYMATRDLKSDKEYFFNLQNKLYKKGLNIYNKKCNNIDIKNYSSLIDLKLDIQNNNLCGKLNEKKLQLVSKYIWDKIRLNLIVENKKAIFVPKDAKCPICGMFIAKYPKWVATIKDNNHIHYFDGVKDMMKFIFLKNKKFIDIKVTDYYTINGIDAFNAFYVYGSNIYGPMGNELIPFNNLEKAKEFLKNHSGKKILKFNEITKKIIYSLDK